jgi:hypothetical protein
MKRFTKILTFAALALSLSSCLKDKNYDDDKYGINIDETESIKIINIPSANTTLTTSATYARTAAAQTQTIPVHLSAKDPAGEPLAVTLAVDADDAKITAYNNTLAAASRYTRMPAASYTVNANGVANIPSGSRDASVSVTITPSTLAAGRYIIPLSIKSVDKSGYTISGNQGYRLILVIIN